ncbi:MULTISPECIES: hypothetical protein [unclassified Clostridium]|uniref:hypothetical protein n=1 Tax=unclassified Clostridium TaxID=2614128 RepID=UPI00321768BA
MGKISKGRKVKALLLMLALAITMSLVPISSAYAATTPSLSVTYVGEAVNLSTDPSYQLWDAGKYQSNTYHPTINLTTKDVAVMFKWTGFFGNSYVSVDGVNLGTTDSFDPNSKVYFLDIQTSGSTTVKTIVVKDLTPGQHTITIKGVTTTGVTKTDYATVNLTY